MSASALWLTDGVHHLDPAIPALLAALLAATAAPGAEPRRVGTVVYATARRLYLDAGAREGLAPGQVLHLESGTCRVEEVSARYATCVGNGRPGDTFALPPRRV